MKISASFLSMEDKNKLIDLDRTNIDYIHVDVMDGIFVPNKFCSIQEFNTYKDKITKPLDIHLMVSDVKKYIDEYKSVNPEIITFHQEAVDDVMGVINYLKDLNIKVGISIKPYSKIEDIINYLPYVDNVLIMSVEPGAGGQKFIDSSIDKIKNLYQLREKQNYNYQIEIDGGINDLTAPQCQLADILVVGSYIYKQDDYQQQITNIKKLF